MLAGWRRLVSLVRGGWSRGFTGAFGRGVLWLAFFRGALVVSWRPLDGDGWVCGTLSRLVDLWVMRGMVMDETQHVFPGGGVG